MRAPLIVGALAGVAVAAGAALAAEAAPLDQVRRAGVLRLCANPSAPPYANRAGPPGLQVELAEAVARAIGVGLAVAWVQTPGEASKAGCDISMDAVALATVHDREGPTGPIRPALLPLSFSKPYAGSGVFLVVRPGAPARSFADLAGEKIGVAVGSIEYQELAKRGLHVSVFRTQQDILDAIAGDEVAAGAVAAPLVGWYRHEHPHAQVEIPDGYVPEPALRWNVTIALWRADDALRAAVNAAIDRVIAERTPERIYAQYGVGYRAPFPAAPPLTQ